MTGSISNVYVAMDRDMDNFKGELINCPGVFYTYGYSWENDVWNIDIIEEVFYTLCPIIRHDLPVREEIISFYNSFHQDMRWVVYADILLCCHGSSLIPRSKFESFIKLDNNKKPSINRQKIHSVLKQKRSEKSVSLFLGKQVKIQPLINCYGHLLSSFAYKIIRYLIDKNSNLPSLPKDYACAVGIDKFVSGLATNVQLAEYYAHYKNLFELLL
jgi:hypothetical protein